MRITIIEGGDLEVLLRALDTGAADIYRLRISQSSDGTVKIAVNSRMWTPALGKPNE